MGDTISAVAAPQTRTFTGEMQKPKKLTLSIDPSVAIAGIATTFDGSNQLGLIAPQGTATVSFGRSKITAWPLKVTVSAADASDNTVNVSVRIMYTDGEIVTQRVNLRGSRPETIRGPEKKAPAKPAAAPSADGDTLNDKADALNARYRAVNANACYANLGMSKSELIKLKNDTTSAYQALDQERDALRAQFAANGVALPWALNDQEWFFTQGRAQALGAIDKVAGRKIWLPWNADYPK